jgi:hypothetical protein
MRTRTKTSIVTTTIYLPEFLLEYAENAKSHEHDVVFIVIGDRKTPDTAADFCREIEHCVYMDLVDQEKYLKRFPELKEHLLVDSISRRNIGHLMAYENGSDVIIMLDDDNFATTDDCIGKHSIVGTTVDLPVFSSNSRWFNVCNALHEIHGVEFYARGYPPAQRWNDGNTSQDQYPCRVAVNGGLWINDPDIDALTRLERPLKTSGMKNGWPKAFALALGTWSPWNCQNTAISAEALPSYFLSPYAGRHLDIWASYVTTRCAEAMGQVIAFGEPLARHDRSPHNLYKDMDQEMPWIRMTDEFCRALRESDIKGSSYLECLSSVIEALSKNWRTDDPVKVQYLKGLKVWFSTFSRLIVQP